jgi:hypothetical protein
MKNALLKFAGLFVERVPIEEPVPGAARPSPAAPQPPAHQQQRPAPTPAAPPPSHGMPPTQQQAPPPALQGHFGSPSGAVAHPPPPGTPRPQDVPPPLSVALRAWVPQEYAGFLAGFGLHVIAAGGQLTPEQASSYGAHVLIVSSECLGADTHLLQHPQMPTVFIAPQPVTMPEVPGVVHVQEPLRASDVAAASRAAVAAWTQTRRQF